mgnify:CR=1 FL=1
MNLFHLDANASLDDVDNELSLAINHALAMAFVMQSEDFRDWNGHVQQNYGHALSEKLIQIETLQQRLGSLAREYEQRLAQLTARGAA